MTESPFPLNLPDLHIHMKQGIRFQMEFIPEAVVNYLSLLGWNPKNGEEIMPVSRIVELFDFSGVVRSNARFDGKKMAHFNMEHIRSLNADEFARRAKESLQKAGFGGDLDSEYARKVYKLSQPKVSSFDTYPSLVYYLFSDEYTYDEASKEKVFKKGDPILRMEEAFEFLSKLDDFSEASLHEAFEKAAAERSFKITEYFPSLRFAISGLSGGPDLLPMLEALGKKRTLERIERFLKTFRK